MKNKIQILLLLAGAWVSSTTSCPTCVGRITAQQEPFFHEHIQQILGAKPAAIKKTNAVAAKKSKQKFAQIKRRK